MFFLFCVSILELNSRLRINSHVLFFLLLLELEVTIVQSASCGGSWYVFTNSNAGTKTTTTATKYYMLLLLICT